MHKLIRLYNQNRKKIWIFIAIIIFVIAFIKLLDYIVKTNNEKDNGQKNTIVDIQSSFEEDKTVISDTEIEENVKKQNSDIIKSFFEACNSKNIEQAYNLLSNSCKEIKYPTLQTFKENYYDTIFTSVKSYNQEAWMEKQGQYTYRIVIIDDPLATGKVSYSNSFQDFYTIVKENNEEKLNISSFVARENLDKSAEKDGITIKVKYRDCTMNDEQYVFEVTNNTDKVVALDSKEKQNTTYLIGESENKYPSYASEMSNTYVYIEEINLEDEIEDEQIEETNEISKDNNITNNIVIPAKTVKQIKIRFNKIYSPNRKITAVEFSDIITDYEKYLSLTNKNQYGERKTINIAL